MQRLNHLIILFFSFFISVKMNGQMVDDSKRIISMRIDSVYRPFEYVEKGNMSEWDTYRANEVDIKYEIFKNGIQSGVFFIVSFNPQGFPVELFETFEGEENDVQVVRLSSDDMFDIYRYILADIDKKYNLRRMYLITSYLIGFDDEILEISKKYEEMVHGKKDDWNLLLKLYGESIIIKGMKEILSLYGKDIKCIEYDKIVYNKIDYSDPEYKGDKSSLPKVVYFPNYITLYLSDKHL